MKDLSCSRVNQTRVRQSFRRGLSSYHEHATAQADIAVRLALLLRQSGAPKHFETALEFGCGTGHLTRQLMKGFGLGHLTLNDLVAEVAPGLGALVEHRVETTDFSFGPIEAVPLPDELELIASASTVQWVADVPSLMARLCARLRPGGWLALSGFGCAQFYQLRALGSGAAAPGYFDAEAWAGMMPKGMELVQVQQEQIVLEFESALALLKHLRRTGVNAQSNQSWSRGRLKAFEAEYVSRFGQNDRLPLTYDPVWIVARKVT